MGILRNKGKRELLYEGMMIVLASFSIGTIWYNTEADGYIIWGTWAIFFIDFLVRFLRSNKKLEFIKANPFLVIAVIPLDAIFQFARFARILHLLRLKTITKYYTRPVIQLLKRQNIVMVISVTFLLVFLALIPLYLLEPELESYGQAFLTSVMTVLFFGRSGFEPVTVGGHVLTVILTVFGVILHGLIISTAFDYVFHSDWFKENWKKLKEKFQ